MSISKSNSKSRTYVLTDGRTRIIGLSASMKSLNMAGRRASISVNDIPIIALRSFYLTISTSIATDFTFHFISINTCTLVSANIERIVIDIVAESAKHNGAYSSRRDASDDVCAMLTR